MFSERLIGLRSVVEIGSLLLKQPGTRGGDGGESKKKHDVGEVGQSLIEARV